MGKPSDYDGRVPEPPYPTLADDNAMLVKDNQALREQLATAEANYAKLHRCVETYMQADPQIRGEAYRDLQGTMEHLAGRNDAVGWPACYHRVALQLAAAQAEIERLREQLCELHCAVWECPHEEFEEASHSDTVEEAHRVNKSEAACRALLREAEGESDV